MLNKFIQRPILSIVLSLLIVFIGVLPYLRLPVTQFPNISPPKVTILADYPGANNELLVKAVVIPLERAINGAPGLKYLASDAGNDGEANIQAVFELVTDPNQATLAVQNRVASVVNKLPPIVVREGVKITREEPNMLLYVNLYSDDPQADQKFLYNFADINVLSELKRVDGVGFADILGNREYAMRIWLKPERMLAFRISADEVMEALSAQGLEASPGKTGESSGKRSQSFEYVLKYPGRFTTKEQYEKVVLRASRAAAQESPRHPAGRNRGRRLALRPPGGTRRVLSGAQPERRTGHARLRYEVPLPLPRVRGVLGHRRAPRTGRDSAAPAGGGNQPLPGAGGGWK